MKLYIFFFHVLERKKRPMLLFLKWHKNKVDPTYSNEGLRASYGLGLKFYSPIGPIGLSWGWPLLKEDEDITRFFTFSVGLLNWNIWF